MKKTVVAFLLVSFCASQAWAGPFSGDGEGGGRGEEFRQKMQERMKSIDTDGNGMISNAEFLAKANERFKKLDTDGSGELSPEELKAARGKFAGRRGGGGFGGGAGGGIGGGDVFP